MHTQSKDVFFYFFRKHGKKRDFPRIVSLEKTKKERSVLAFYVYQTMLG